MKVLEPATDSSQEQKMLHAIYRSFPSPFGVFDLVNDKVVRFNNSLVSILGYSQDELVRFSENNFVDIIHEEDLEEHFETKRKLRESGEGEVLESVFRVRTSGGSYACFHTYKTVFDRDEYGRPVLAISIAKDITEEAELKSRLNQSMDVIRSIKYKNSHDLRAPVTNILGIIKLMDPNALPDSYQKELFKHLLTTVEKLDDIIHQINEMAN